MAVFETLSDGTRVYQKRGATPVPPEGFETCPGDPYRITPILPECPHRFQGCTVMVCGKKIYFRVCRKGYTISLTECSSCIESGRRDS